MSKDHLILQGEHQLRGCGIAGKCTSELGQGLVPIGQAQARGCQQHSLLVATSPWTAADQG